MRHSIREQLQELAEENYRNFSSNLLPNVENILGVRFPQLRRLAKKIAKENGKLYLKTARDDTFEEIMLQGMVIGYLKSDAEELLGLVSDFVRKINNWSVCDSFCIGLKFVKENRERVWRFLQPYFRSANEFEIRFAVVLLIDYFIEAEYLERVLNQLNAIRHEGYYVKMAVAWAVSICYVKFPERTLVYLRENMLDDFTYHKSLQKITESYCVDREQKAVIRGMKRH